MCVWGGSFPGLIPHIKNQKGVVLCPRAEGREVLGSNLDSVLEVSGLPWISFRSFHLSADKYRDSLVAGQRLMGKSWSQDREKGTPVIGGLSQSDFQSLA